MPLFPSFNDLRNVTISINPLNFFSDAPKGPDSPRDAGVGEAGPGPSSLAHREATARPGRPGIRTGSSSSDSFDDGSEGGAKGGVVIQEQERPKRERRKKVPTDTYIIVKPPPASSKNPLNLQIQLVVNKGGRGRSDSTATRGSRSPSLFSDSSGPPVPAPDQPRSASMFLPTIKDGLAPVASGSQPQSKINLNTSQEGLERKRSESPSQASSDEQVGTPSTIASTTATGLRRITSRKNSTTSIPASTTSASGQKRIQPVFNLNVHSVMHSTMVTDAGTDARVAKFGKRAIDIVDVGVLEPSEIWYLPSTSSAFFPPGSALEESKSRPVSTYSLTTSLSPAATRVAEESNRGRNSLDLKGLRPEILQEGGATAKRFFGKIGGAFKKKGSAEKDTAMPSSPALGSAGNSSAGGTLRGEAREGTTEVGLSVGAPTFGCSPVVIARRLSNPRLAPAFADCLAPPDNASIASATRAPQPSVRPVGYSWTVKTWAKRNTEGWAAHLVAAAAQGVMMKGSLCGDGDDEVVFEWSKGKGRTASRSRRNSDACRPLSRLSSRIDSPSHTGPQSRAGAFILPGRASAPGTPKLDGATRPEPVRRSSAVSSLSPNKTDASPPLADDSSAVYHTAEEDDSDPEDSETPWLCSLINKRTGQRQILGTITPAPHHPKVVGQLRLPSKMESLCLAELVGADQDAVDRVKGEVCLSAEAVKDVVCVTALWLVTREGWNGLGKVRRGR